MNARITNQTQNLKPALQAADVFQQVSVTHTTAATLAALGVTVDASVKTLHITAGGDVSYVDQTLTGTPVSPTGVIGHLLRSGQELFLSSERAMACKWIATGTGAVLNITKLTE